MTITIHLSKKNIIRIYLWINCTEYLFLVSMRARDWKKIMFFNRQFLTLDLIQYISSSHGMSCYLPLNRPIGWYVIAIIIWYGFYCISLRNTNNKILTRGNDSFIPIQDLALVFKWLWICCHLDLYNHSFKKCYRTTLVQIHVSGWVTFTLVTQVCVCIPVLVVGHRPVDDDLTSVPHPSGNSAHIGDTLVKVV